MTSDRPYRQAGRWRDAGVEVLRQSGRQFDPIVVRAFRACEPDLRTIRAEFAAA
jgi:HD-GYP domain-containing protein (c-di-GMP phosphodiesterase class II)